MKVLNRKIQPTHPTDPTDPGIDEIVIHSPDLIGVDENQEFITEINASGVAGVVLSYSILYGDDNGLFKLNQATGDLSFIAPGTEMPEDANMDNLYEVTIEVSGGTKNALLNLKVEVLDAEETGPTDPSNPTGPKNPRVRPVQPVQPIRKNRRSNLKFQKWFICPLFGRSFL